ncbi:MAG: peptidase M17 [Myxococcaceae bacterium]|nr:peptidase M17 [Myxococcaceae bacterium]
MSMVKEPSLHSVDTLDDLDAVVCLVPDDQRPLQGGAGFLDWRLCGALSRALDQGFFSGAPGERLLLPSEGRVAPPKIFAVGLGAMKTVTALGLEHALGASLAMLEKVKAEHVALAIPPLPQLDASAVGGVLGRAFVSKWKQGRVVVLGEPALEAAITR